METWKIASAQAKRDPTILCYSYPSYLASKQAIIPTESPFPPSLATSWATFPPAPPPSSLHHLDYLLCHLCAWQTQPGQNGHHLLSHQRVLLLLPLPCLAWASAKDYFSLVWMVSQPSPRGQISQRNQGRRRRKRREETLVPKEEEKEVSERKKRNRDLDCLELGTRLNPEIWQRGS